METCRSLPAPEVCKVEKFISSADYWTCLVEAPAPCRYVVMIGSFPICSMASKSGTSLKSRIEGRKIAVRFPDSSLGVVSPVRLDEMIDSGRIAAFKRASGWVDIAVGPVRQASSLWRFKGLQRRAGWKRDEADMSPDPIKRVCETEDSGD